VANVIEGLAKRLDNLSAEVADDAVRAFIVIAERNGGTMIGGKYQLTAKVAKRFDRPGSSWVLMEGVPSGFWAWRETGTRPHEIRPKRKRRGKRSTWTPGPMGGGLGHPVWGPVIHPGVPGRMLWTKTCNEGDEMVGVLTRRALEELNDG
jgi:hypothetical protein